MAYSWASYFNLFPQIQADGFPFLYSRCRPGLRRAVPSAHGPNCKADLTGPLSGTAARLERTCRQDEALFEKYPITVVSADFIKSERRRHEFLRACPELVMVDEAHTCSSGPGRSSAQQRHELLRALVDPSRPEGAARHMILVTATPHSGNEDAFRSLLALLDPRFSELPQDLSGDGNRRHREALAKHFVQRRRGDLKAYLDTVTPFPDREIAEDHYELRPAYRKLLLKVLSFCRESVLDESLEKRHQRIRWWSALALLRSLSSSPAAAAATLRNRSTAASGETIEEIDEEGRRAVLDLDEVSAEGTDVVPGSDTGEEEKKGARERLLRLAREAEALTDKDDAKLTRATKLVKGLLDEGFSPIVFCRFIPTVDYVVTYLRKKLERGGVVIEGVTGLQPPDEREQRVEALGKNPKRVLVCTDCLSEGINLQHGFNAVLHYDLSWNPTRHEQREGRVDRYGQPKKKVRTLTFYGKNNPIDGIVLQVLLRKHKSIHQQLGITVPVPMDTRVVEDAILEGLLIREVDIDQLELDFLEPLSRPVDLEWDEAVEREKRNRTVFAQAALLKAVNTEVRGELNEVRRALGAQADVYRFVETSIGALGGVASGGSPLQVDLTGTPTALRESMGLESESSFRAIFDGVARDGERLLTRTHPIVEGLATHMLETALDPALEGPARRCGVIRTRAVDRRTTVMLLRLRFHIVSLGRDGATRPLLAEDLVLAGFTGSPQNAEWLPQDDLEPLLGASADANVLPDQAREQIARLIGDIGLLQPQLDKIADERGAALLDAHRRVRKASASGVRALSVDVHKPGDVIGLYVYLPVAAGGAS